MLGVLLSIGFWARVDLGLLGVAIVLDQIWLTVLNSQPSPAIRAKNICVCSIVALCLASPWIIFTIISTGNILPVSGKAVHLITTTFFDFYHPDHSSFLSMMLMYFKKEFLIYQPLAALSEITLWQLITTGMCFIGLFIITRNHKLREFYRPVFIFQTIMIIAYIGFIGGFWHLNRYFYPVYTLMLLIHGATLHWLESKVKIKPWLIGILLFILFIPYGYSYTRQYYSPWIRKGPPRYLSIALFAKDNIPPNAKVGAFQSGCVSYWLDNPVINLDGVMNEDAYIHLKNKTMDVYLDDQQIDYLVEEVFLFEMWNKYLGGQLSNKYIRVASRENKLLPKSWQKFAIYKCK